jgi:hypothetical protein
MAGILNTVYSLAVLVVVLAGIVFVLGMMDTGEEGTSWWGWGVLIVVAVFLVAQVGMILMAA